MSLNVRHLVRLGSFTALKAAPTIIKIILYEFGFLGSLLIHWFSWLIQRFPVLFQPFWIVLIIFLGLKWCKVFSKIENNGENVSSYISTLKTKESEDSFADRLEDWICKNRQIIIWVPNTSILSIHQFFGHFNTATDILVWAGLTNNKIVLIKNNAHFTFQDGSSFHDIL